MYFVYILKSLKNNKRYIGLTNDVSRRLSEHERGISRFTSQNRPWKLVCVEKYSDKLVATKREKFLKSGVGRAFLKSNGF